LFAGITIFFQKIPLHLGEIFKLNSGGEFGCNSSKTSFRAMYQFSSGKVTNFPIFNSSRIGSLTLLKTIFENANQSRKKPSI